MESFNANEIPWDDAEKLKTEFLVPLPEIRIMRPTEKVLELRRELEVINFSMLRHSFELIYSRCGLDPKDMNFFDIENIGTNTGAWGTETASFSPGSNSLDVSVDGIRKRIYEKTRNPEVALLHVIAHEETHAVGRLQCQQLPDREGWPLYSGGYSVMADKPVIDEAGQRANVGPMGGYGLQQQEMYSQFNEGMTELIAFEVVENYLTAKGEYDKKKIDDLVNERETDVYGPAIRLVKGFIYRLSKATGIAEGDILEKLKEGYFKGNDFLKEKFREYLESLLGTDYMEQLALGKINSKVLPDRSPTEQWIRDVKAFFIKAYRRLT